MSENQHFTQQNPENFPPLGHHQARPKIKSLTTLMIANIAILAIVGVASILVMLFGDFDGKGIRVASTFLVFAAFTAFTALDSNDRKPGWHLPIGQIGNIYMLGLSLIQIWATLGTTYRYGAEMNILGNVLMIIIAVKIGTIVVQKITDLAFVEQQALAVAARISALSFAGATILYTLPSGVGWIDFFEFDDGYWRFSTAVILLAGLSLAITVLLAWFYGILPAKPRQKTAVAGSNATQYQPQQSVNAVPDSPVFQKPQAPQRTPQSTPVQTGQHGIPVFEPPVKGALSWPVFPSGLPLPAKPNGRPDFGALREIAKVYDEAEKQWFGQ